MDINNKIMDALKSASKTSVDKSILDKVNCTVCGVTYTIEGNTGCSNCGYNPEQENHMYEVTIEDEKVPIL